MQRHTPTRRSRRTRSGARGCFDRAIAYRLKWNVTLAQQHELMAWVMPDCTPIVSAEYYLELAVKLACEHRISDATQALERAEMSGVLQQSRKGRQMIDAARRVVAFWRRVCASSSLPA